MAKEQAKGMDKLKHETAEELGLDKKLKGDKGEMTTREAGKIGGNMVRKLIKEGKEEMTE